MSLRHFSVLVFILSSLPLASAQADATVTVIHGIPGGDLELDPALPVDVSANGACVIQGLEFGQISDRLAVPAGEYDFAVSLSDGACGGDVVLTADDVPLADGANATAIAHLTEDGGITLSAYINDASAVQEDEGRLAVHHNAAAPAVDIVAYQFAEGDFIPTVELKGVINPQSAAADVTADFYSVSIAPEAGAAIALESLQVPEGELTLVYAVGSLSTGSFQLIVDRQPVGTEEEPAIVTVIHGINGIDLDLDEPLPVDVFVAGVGCALTNFTFGEISDRLELPPGEYDIEIRLSDGECGGPVAVSKEGVPFAAGENATVIAHLTEEGTPDASKFTNDVSEGRGRLAVHHTAAAGAVDIDVFRAWFWFFKKVLGLDGVTNGQSASEDLYPGKYYARITPAGSKHKLFFDRVPIPYNTAVFVYAVGTPENGTFQVLVDSQPID
jgi:hypothetical protein